MPRQARIDIPGLLQHVIVRGVNRSNIFLEDRDRCDFVERLTMLLSETKTVCYAWALLNNHFHLLLMPTEQTLATFMRRLLTGYAVSFNLRQSREGHLFQNRYKSLVCDQDSYLLELIRYIHLNPIRAGIVDDLAGLETYRWSGHPQLLAKSTSRILDEDAVLAMFARSKKQARSAYLQFVSEGIEQKQLSKFSQGGRRASQCLDPSLEDDDYYDDRILGGGDFVTQVLGEQSPEKFVPTLNVIITTVAEHYKISVQELKNPCREKNIVRAKAVICYLAIRRSGITGVEVGRRLSYSTSAVSQAAKRGQGLYESNEGLRRLI